MRPPPAVLLHCFTDAPRTRETTAWLRDHTAELETFEVRVDSRLMQGDGDYYNAWASLWYEAVTIINLEHDIVPTVEAIASLARCAYPACTQYYRGRPPSADTPMVFREVPIWEPESGQSYMSADSVRDGIPDFCDRTGFGLVKLDYRTRVRHPLPVENVGWLTLDSVYTGNIKMREPCFKWHVHGPEVRHNQ